MQCPKCSLALSPWSSPEGMTLSCQRCQGELANLAVMRKRFPSLMVQRIWDKAKNPGLNKRLSCPSCHTKMVELILEYEETRVALDLCPVCQLLWLDQGDAEKLQILRLSDKSLTTTKASQDFSWTKKLEDASSASKPKEAILGKSKLLALALLFLDSYLIAHFDLGFSAYSFLYGFLLVWFEDYLHYLQQNDKKLNFMLFMLTFGLLNKPLPQKLLLVGGWLLLFLPVLMAVFT